MANTRSARKRIRTNHRKHVRNMMYRSRAKTMIKRAEQDIFGEAPAEETLESVRSAIQTLDRAANKGIIHRNNAARRKSRLMKKFNALSQQQPA